MPQENMPEGQKIQQLSFFNFPAESIPFRKKTSRKPKPTVKTKHKKPEVIYTYQFTSKAHSLPIHRVSTRSAAEFMQKKARSLRPGVVHRSEGFHGGTLVATWAGVNPEDRRGYLWDIHVELAS
ncbi:MULTISPECIES: hypothetical protein [Cyanophyceae]|uniref:Uncharacterized protein n=1 Tax=Leptolyngbya subtilissima DQ-A4 TaxID=2933933 RepID=A0ABV0KBD4_9CYAN|nr:hypothetical protein [Nodosilinea sp. FACHB-141]MBD2115063.1 hypothetical protein [Nodosilinea sp. FACHB-141]